MGSLSLERVQFKFASIIGELCSEPLLLSQFAVWLDIKLAEYKAKGSISLDCSGEKPEPPWMKGILPPSPDSLPSGLFEVKNDPAETLQTKSPFRSAAQNTSKQSYSASRMQHAKSSSAQSFNPETVTSRLSSGDDIIVIKEEDDNSVAGYYNPSGAYSNISGQPTSQSTFLDSYTESAAQKRLSTDNILNVGQPSPKVGRFAAPSAAGSPSSVSSLSNPSTSREVTGYDPNSSEDRLQPPDSNADSWLGQVTAERDIDTSGVDVNSIRLNESNVSSENMNSPSPNRLVPPVVSSTEATMLCQSIDGRFGNLTGKTVSTARHCKVAVKTFENWLRRYHRDPRRIEEIPPPELDGFLADFFRTVQRQSGHDYTHRSFQSLRSYLECYLREQNYPCSITSSRHFPKSQLSYRVRRSSMRQASVIPMENPVDSTQPN